MSSPICDGCAFKCKEGEICTAKAALLKLYDDLRTEEKTELIRQLRKDLNLLDYEVADDLQELGLKVIDKMPELSIIREFNIKVGFVRSYEAKRDKGKLVFADCRKVTGTYLAFLPFDFVITFYEPNVYYMTENQKKILMLHELRHIGIGERGLKIENHDIEDFESILQRYGLNWNGFNQDCPDILADNKAGGDGETKGNKVETKLKANSNGRSPSKPRRSANKD